MAWLPILFAITLGMAGCNNNPGNTDPVTDTTALEGAIDEAQTLADDTEDKVWGDETDPADVPISTEYWLQADWDALNDAIAAAEDALNASTQTAVTNAATALANAIEAFYDAVKIGEKSFTLDEVAALLNKAKAAIEAAESSDDGSDIPETDDWVQTAIYEALEAAIDALEKASGETATDAAYLALESALKAFESAIEKGTIHIHAFPLAHTPEKAATCVDTGNPDYWTCSVCENHYEDEEGTKELTTIVTPINPDNHHFDDENWESDNDQHWHECECREKKDGEAHTVDTWTPTKPATFSADGEEEGTCTVCDETVTRPIPDSMLSPLTSIAEVTAYLAGQDTNTADDPIPLKLDFPLGTMTLAASDWQLLLTALDTAGKYVELDLSDCAMTGTVFNPVSTVPTGKDKIVAITLPEAGETITAGPGILSSAFNNFANLESVVIPYGYTAIPNYAFGYCNSLTSVTIPDSVTSIGSDAFYVCSSLESVIIGNSVTSIGTYAFQNCAGLTSVTIGNSVRTIGNYAFQNCSSLTSVTIPDSVTSIGTDTFTGCTGLASVTIGNSVTSIGNQAFDGCTGLTSVTIGNGVESIRDNAFRGCTGLTSITIPDSVTSIGSYAFQNCTSLASVTIGNSVESIGNSAFYGCTGLASVTFERAGTTFNTTSFYASFPNAASLETVYAEGGIGTYTRDNSTVPIPNTVEWVKR